MKKLLLTISLLAAAHAPARATTVTLDSEVLKDEFGMAMPTTGLVVLTAGTSGNFYGPTATSFTGGDEIVLKKWDLSAFGMAGVLSDTTGDLMQSGAWNTGDPLRMYWYPTLTLASTAPGLGTKYGTYRDAVGVDGSMLWITGSASDTVALKFYTADATFLNMGGSNSAAAGVANLTVSSLPEPGAPALCLVSLMAAMGVVRQRRK